MLKYAVLVTQEVMAQPPRKPIRIAVADDHTIFRDGLRQVLATEPDLEVVGEACNGLEVPKLLSTCDPDILLLDLKMPVLDGLAALQRLAGQKLKTRVIVLTASEDRDEHTQATELGAAAVVLKRDSTDSLTETIRRVYKDERRRVVVAKLPNPRPTAVADLELPITAREREIADLAVQRLTNKEMAQKLAISEQTVKNHLRNIFGKLGFSDRLQLALYVVNRQRGTNLRQL